jgi:hypothetical protein
VAIVTEDIYSLAKKADHDILKYEVECFIGIDTTPTKTIARRAPTTSHEQKKAATSSQQVLNTL